LVTDAFAGTNEGGELLAINPLTGVRTLLTDFGNPAEGPLGRDPDGVLWIPSASTLVVVDGSAGTNGLGALFAVDRATGNRTVISDFGNSAQGAVLGSYPNGVAVVQ
jgi:hypothetical protein